MLFFARAQIKQKALVALRAAELQRLKDDDSNIDNHKQQVVHIVNDLT